MSSNFAFHHYVPKTTTVHKYLITNYYYVLKWVMMKIYKVVRQESAKGTD